MRKEHEMLESRSAYGYYGVAGGYTGETAHEGNRVRMPYREYKSKWSVHKTVRGSYDSKDKTIEVLFTDAEMLAKTNLGNRYSMNSYFFRVDGVETGVKPAAEFKAKTRENALRNARRWCKSLGYTLGEEITFGEYWMTGH